MSQIRDKRGIASRTEQSVSCGEEGSHSQLRSAFYDLFCIEQNPYSQNILNIVMFHTDFTRGISCGFL